MISNYKSTFLTRVLTLPTRSMPILLSIALLLLLSAPGKSIAAELVHRSISWEGKQRTYHIHKGENSKNPLPLVVVFHGGGGSGKILKETYGFEELIDSGEFIAVYPDARPGGWLPDDVSFADAVIEEVFADERIDRNRLFVTGASRGGLLTFVMAAKSRHAIRAAGTVIASQLQGLADEFPFSRPIDFMMIAGTADPLMPYNGGFNTTTAVKSEGDPKARVLPVEETIGMLLKANDIHDSPKISSLGDIDPNDGCTNELRLWVNATTGHRTALVKIEGGGHVVPGRRQYLPKETVGAACNDFDHAEVMWKFFKSSKAAGKAMSTMPPSTKASFDAKTEKLLRERVNELFEALRKGDIAKCIELSDPAVVKSKGRDTAEKFFKGVSGLVKFAKVQSSDRTIKTITAIEDGQAAKVEIELTLKGKKQPPGYEIWKLIDGQWFYRETTK